MIIDKILEVCRQEKPDLDWSYSFDHWKGAWIFAQHKEGLFISIYHNKCGDGYIACAAVADNPRACYDYVDLRKDNEGGYHWEDETLEILATQLRRVE